MENYLRLQIMLLIFPLISPIILIVMELKVKYKILKGKLKFALLLYLHYQKRKNELSESALYAVTSYSYDLLYKN